MRDDREGEVPRVLEVALLVIGLTVGLSSQATAQLAISGGGTGATNPPDARTNLGLADHVGINTGGVRPSSDQLQVDGNTTFNGNVDVNGSLIATVDVTTANPGSTFIAQRNIDTDVNTNNRAASAQMFLNVGSDTAVGFTGVSTRSWFNVGSTQVVTFASTVGGTPLLKVQDTGQLEANTAIRFTAPSGGTLPTGVSAGTTYYTTKIDNTHYTISTTPGGTQILFVDAGAGTIDRFTFVPSKYGNVFGANIQANDFSGLAATNVTGAHGIALVGAEIDVESSGAEGDDRGIYHRTILTLGAGRSAAAPDPNVQNEIGRALYIHTRNETNGPTTLLRGIEVTNVSDPSYLNTVDTGISINPGDGTLNNGILIENPATVGLSIVGDTPTNGHLVLESTGSDAALLRLGRPVNNSVARIEFYRENTSGVSTIYGKIFDTVLDNSTTSTGANRITFSNMVGGAMTDVLMLEDGMTLPELNSAPAAPPPNRVTIYAVDNGSGKTQLMALFHSGAAQQLSIQP